MLGLVWFVAAARMLTDESYGVLATGLAFFAIFAGVGDLGTTRGIVRHVAPNKNLLWPVYRHALVVRIVGGVLAAVVVATIIAVIPVPVSPGIVFLAGLVATASGATELAYAALRSVGLVRTEMTLLLVERTAFVGVGLVVLQAGGEAIAILLVYLATNLVSASVGGWRVWRTASFHVPQNRTWSLADSEARSTAVAFALLTVSPRIVPVLLALIVSATAVADFSVAQRPVEAMTLFALSTAAPVLPIVRERLTSGRVEDAERAAVSGVTAICLTMTPALAWFIVSPSMFIDLFFGVDRYDSAAAVLRILSITALTWSFRGVAEFVLLAEERARWFLGVTLVGLAVTLIIGFPVLNQWGATGGAWTLLIAESAMTIFLVFSTPLLASWSALRSYLVIPSIGTATAATLMLARSSTVISVVAVGFWSAVALGGAILLSRRLEAT